MRYTNKGVCPIGPVYSMIYFMYIAVNIGLLIQNCLYLSFVDSTGSTIEGISFFLITL